MKFILPIGFALFMPAAQAVSIGEIVVQSSWGEPLQAHVELRTVAGEVIEESCVMLVAPDAQDEESSVYLTKATLGVKRDAGRQLVTISTSRPFREMFAKIRLQVKCANGGGMTKVLTILPDLDMTEKFRSDEATPTLATVLTDKTIATLPDANTTATVAAHKDEQLAKNPKKILAPLKKHVQPQPAKSTLKITAEKFDVSEMTQTNVDNHTLLQKIKELNADDQLAAMLAMQNEIQKLRDELNEIKAGIQVIPKKPAVPTPPPPPPVVASAEYGTSFWLGSFSGLLLLGMLGLRYFSRNKRNPARAKIAPTVNETTSSEAATKTPAGELTQIISAYTASRDNPSDTELMMEEAQLYAAHSRPQKAIQILTELIDAHPQKMDAWLALFTNYASLHEAAQFEKLAERFQQIKPDDHTWALVQSLGRTLEREHPLYQEKLEIFPRTDAVTADATDNSFHTEDKSSADEERFKPLEFELDFPARKT